MTSACSLLGPLPAEDNETASSSEITGPAIQSTVATPNPVNSVPAAPATIRHSPPPPVAPPHQPQPLLVLQSSDAESYRTVAEALTPLLSPDYEVMHVTVDPADDSTRRFDLQGSAWTAVIAIGAAAARMASKDFAGPIVICQVFDVESFLDGHDATFAIAALPSPQLQLGSWAEIAGSAQSVGIIVSASDSAVVSAAEAAGASLGIDVIAEFAESDREAIYRFKRLARDVDGLWLFPDSAILGPAVMREMFAYAREHGVHTIVFSPALLDWGALISVGSSADEIAAAVAGAVEKIRHGQTADLPRVTALKVVDIAINEEVAIAVDFGGTGRQVDDLSTAQTRAR